MWKSSKVNVNRFFFPDLLYFIIVNRLLYLADNLRQRFRVVLGWAYRGLTGGFPLLQNFSVAIM